MLSCPSWWLAKDSLTTWVMIGALSGMILSSVSFIANPTLLIQSATEFIILFLKDSNCC